jgi:hypothetical protein
MFRHTIPIGHIFGIAIELDYSWFLVFGLLTWALAVSYLCGALASRYGQPSTNFLFLREGKVYFEGGPQAVLEPPDAYLNKFLVLARS